MELAVSPIWKSLIDDATQMTYSRESTTYSGLSGSILNNLSSWDFLVSTNGTIPNVSSTQNNCIFKVALSLVSSSFDTFK